MQNRKISRRWPCRKRRDDGPLYDEERHTALLPRRCTTVGVGRTRRSNRYDVHNFVQGRMCGGEGELQGAMCLDMAGTLIVECHVACLAGFAVLQRY